MLGYSEGADMRMSNNEPARVGDLLNNFLKDRGLEKQISRTGAIEIWKKLWEQILLRLRLPNRLLRQPFLWK